MVPEAPSQSKIPKNPQPARAEAKRRGRPDQQKEANLTVCLTILIRRAL